MFKNRGYFILVGLVIVFSCNMDDKLIYQNDDFKILEDRVSQGNFEAVAVSETHLTSNYQSPENFISQKLSFKFSVNGWDNELPYNQFHQLIVDSGTTETPIIKFGEQYLDKKQFSPNKPLGLSQKLTFKVDMREVLNAFDSKGFYQFTNGSIIYKSDFKGVFLAGDVLPLNLDFDNLAKTDQFKLTDDDGDGIYSISFILNKKEEQKHIATSWQLKNDISSFPQYQSNSVLANAIYNLSLDEMQNAIEPDSTLRTGLEWVGVWTRDISYSIILSMATLQPRVAMISLMKKVDGNKIIQDTGTGGSYPVSSDRMVWAIAAYEVYKVTGDKDWLNTIYPIIKNSVENDEKIVYDEKTGLVKGESSFLDWREQTYPKWMQPADIYESESLGTNAVHYQVNKVLAELANIKGDKQTAAKHLTLANSIKTGINTYLWQPEKGYYGQFLYGRQHKILSDRAEALGEALTVLFGIADEEKTKSIFENTPLLNYGIPCIYPQIPEIPPYHNNAIWPFVQSYWALAAAKAGCQNVFMHAVVGIYRSSALFLTNKENFVATSGDYAGTVINSSNMLWSLSGNLSLVYKGLFGIQYDSDQLRFAPLVPKALKGVRNLKNFNYRNAQLDIEVEGFGQIHEFYVDGEKKKDAIVPANLEGKHRIKIVLNNKTDEHEVDIKENRFSLATPVVSISDKKLSWKPIDGASKYILIKNGKKLKTISQNYFDVTSTGEYQVIAVDKDNVQSFASEPVLHFLEDDLLTYEIEHFAINSAQKAQGFQSDGFVQITKSLNTEITISTNINQAGLYALNFRYANGSGPKNTDNKCAIRTLSINNTSVGAMIFPQRGQDEWSNWGLSNTKIIHLNKGENTFKLVYSPENENMNRDVNTAYLDQMVLTKIRE